MKFEPEDDAIKIEDTKKYLSNLGVSDKAKLSKQKVDKTALAKRNFSLIRAHLIDFFAFIFTFPQAP